MELLEILLILVAVLVVSSIGWYVIGRRRPDIDTTDATVPPEAAERTAVEPPPLRRRLGRTTESLGGALRHLFGRGRLDEEFWDGMEEALIAADVGVTASTEIVERIRDDNPADVDEAKAALRVELGQELAGRDRSMHLGDEKPAVVLVVGVNGSGKTTSIAKLARRLMIQGSTPLLGAADTFRAAADRQLREWGDRLDVDVVGGHEGSDPASVAFDSFAAARARGRDVVIVDTAGRLQSKHNLMSELAKIRRVVEREAGHVDEVLLVLDATSGQNGIAQVQEFTTAVGVTGIVLTKLDGTARGGVVVAVERQLDVPVKFVGVGEGLDDLIEFQPADFVDALLAEA